MWMNKLSVVENGRLQQLAIAFHGVNGKASQQQESETALRENCHPGGRLSSDALYAIPEG